jgi:hypothetical protein
MPCQIFWSGMLGLGRGGQRQLRFSIRYQALVSPSKQSLIRQTMPDELFDKVWPRGRIFNRAEVHVYARTLFICCIAKKRDPERSSGCCLIVNALFPAKKGVQNWTFTKMSPIMMRTPLISWHQGGAFGNPFSGRDFRPVPPCPPGHLQSQTECAGVLRYI